MSPHEHTAVALTYSEVTITFLAPTEDADTAGSNTSKNVNVIIKNLNLGCGSISSEIISSPYLFSKLSRIPILKNV